MFCPPQVFDVRMTPRMLSSVPFAPGPSLLRFHPRFSSTLLLASASGAFTLADAQGMSGAAPELLGVWFSHATRQLCCCLLMRSSNQLWLPLTQPQRFSCPTARPRSRRHVPG